MEKGLIIRFYCAYLMPLPNEKQINYAYILYRAAKTIYCCRREFNYTQV